MLSAEPSTKVFKMKKAKVHSIQTMGTLDGPGIRYVLFLQGCPFRCLFCHNPDTWGAVVDKVNEKSADELIKDVLKYKSFYDNSGGGVTVSGGEPLLQIPFLIEFFKGLKEYNINTALDTCGHVAINDKLDKLLKYTDIILLDIKHLDKEKHKVLTGQENQKTLEFLEYINKLHKRIWIRQVLTPKYTMDNIYINKLIDFLKQYDIEKVELLPYHDMARSKYEKLGIKYPLENTPIPAKEDVESIKHMFVDAGFCVV